MAANKQRAIRWIENERGCWLCTSHSCNEHQYPTVRIGGGKRVPISRHVYIRKDPFLQAEEVVRHTCDDPRCINPAHLIKGTTLDNMRDKVDRGRQLRGQQLPWAKLNENNVREIRRRYAEGGITQQALADEYGITVENTWKILHGRKWAWVK